VGRKLIIGALAVLLLINITSYTETSGERYFDKALKNAAVTFAVARALNGLISIMQHAEISAAPAGVGLTVAPFQILDPLNDIVEQFSTVMLLATVSLAIQKLLLTISGWWIAKLVISGLLLLSIIFLVLDSFHITRMNKNLLLKILVPVLFVRFVIPFVAISSGVVEDLFLNEPIQAKTEKLKLIEQSAARAIGVDEEHQLNEGMIAKGKSLLNVKENTALLWENVSKSISTIIDLIALFIIQTVLLPLVFLYLAVKLIKLVFMYDFERLNPGNKPAASRKNDQSIAVG
jgi:hypothetical protein